MPGSITIVSKRSKNAQKAFRDIGYELIDVTSNSDQPTFKRFSPFYPHGSIPIPGLDGTLADSVEGIWQGLKVFENEGIDTKKFNITSMKNLKRPGGTGTKRGACLGHSYRNAIVDYLYARKNIYLPAYTHILENKLQNEINLLKGLLQEGKNIALLDYETNDNIDNPYKPLSHAALIIQHLRQSM